MKFVYVIEDDPRLQKDIFDSLQFIDLKIQIRLFTKLEGFVDWMRGVINEGPGAILKGGVSAPGVQQEEPDEGPHQLALIIAKVEIIGLKQLPFLKKSREILIQKGLCTAEEPTAIVLTAFDDPKFNRKELADRVINNIIFKPFDRLILTQHLTFAVDGRHPPSKYTIANQKTSTNFEMLKDVPIEAISEFGFVTRSNHQIPVGSVAKYYGEAFVTERHRSMIAVCDSCTAHPQNAAEFQVSLRFFAADPTQISNIRKRVRLPGTSEVSFSWAQPSAIPGGAFNVVVIDPDESGPSGLGVTLERKFSGLKVTHYDHYKNFLLELDPNQVNSKDEVPAKPFSTGPELVFVFDAHGGTLLGFDKTDADAVTLFGVGGKDFLNKSQWLQGHLIDPHKDKFRGLFKSASAPSDPYFLNKSDGIDYLLKLVSRDVQSDGHVALKFAEATKEDWIVYLQKSSRLPARVDAVLVSHRYLGEAPAERWNWVTEMLKKRGASHPRIFLLSVRDYSDVQEREMATYLTDIFFRPVDRGYLAIKFFYYFSFLKVTEDPITLRTIAQTKVVKVANPIKVVELSEAGFVMEYYRAISIGSFREVVLWQPYEVGAPELLSNCNYTEVRQGQKGTYACHFVFFGMTDLFLKNLRVWIRDNYVLSKEAT